MPGPKRAVVPLGRDVLEDGVIVTCTVDPVAPLAGFNEKDGGGLTTIGSVLTLAYPGPETLI